MRRSPVVVLALLAALAALACGEQVSRVTDVTASAIVRSALRRQGTEMRADMQCKSSLAPAGGEKRTVHLDCTGTTDAGEPVAASVETTGENSAKARIDVAGKTVVDSTVDARADG